MCAHTSGRLQSLSCQTPETQSFLSPCVTDREAARMNHHAMGRSRVRPCVLTPPGAWLPTAAQPGLERGDPE